MTPWPASDQVNHEWWCCLSVAVLIDPWWEYTLSLGPWHSVADRSRCTYQRPDVKWLIYTGHYKLGEAQEIDQGNYRIKRKPSSIDFRRAKVELGLTCRHIVSMRATHKEETLLHTDVWYTLVYDPGHLACDKTRIVFTSLFHKLNSNTHIIFNVGCKGH